MLTSLTGTILLVDDEDAVRLTLRRQIDTLGHTVLEAKHGIEALHIARTHHGKLDLVLTDAVMPMMNGTELAATLLDEFPELPIILMSAYVPTSLTRVGFRHAVVPVLRKPFESAELADIIQMVLRRPRSPGSDSSATAAI